MNTRKSASRVRQDATIDGREVRGDITREKLILTAIRFFDSDGYAAVSTRALAKEAGTNQAAILYHFGSKEGLYLAVAEHIVHAAKGALGPLIEAAEQESSAAGARKTLVALLTVLLRMTVGGIPVNLIVHEQTRPGPAFDILYSGYLRATHKAITRSLALATGRSEADHAVIVDAHALIGTALSFAVSRETFLKRVGRRTYQPDMLALVEERVLAIVQSFVGPARRQGKGNAPNGEEPPAKKGRVRASPARAPRKRGLSQTVR